jgi:hypothetical protein
VAGEVCRMNRRSAVLLCLLLPLGLAGCVIAEEGGYRRGYGAREFHHEDEDHREGEDRHARGYREEREDEYHR